MAKYYFSGYEYGEVIEVDVEDKLVEEVEDPQLIHSDVGIKYITDGIKVADWLTYIMLAEDFGVRKYKGEFDTYEVLDLKVEGVNCIFYIQQKDCYLLSLNDERNYVQCLGSHRPELTYDYNLEDSVDTIYNYDCGMNLMNASFLDKSVLKEHLKNTLRGEFTEEERDKILEMHIKQDIKITPDNSLGLAYEVVPKSKLRELGRLRMMQVQKANFEKYGSHLEPPNYVNPLLEQSRKAINYELDKGNMEPRDKSFNWYYKMYIQSPVSTRMVEFIYDYKRKKNDRALREIDRIMKKHFCILPSNIFRIDREYYDAVVSKKQFVYDALDYNEINDSERRALGGWLTCDCNITGSRFIEYDNRYFDLAGRARTAEEIKEAIQIWNYGDN